MSKRTTKAEKRDIILAIFHESRGADRVWILKDLEKAAKYVWVAHACCGTCGTPPRGP